MEFEEEERFNNDKESMNKQINVNIEMKEKSNKNLFSSIFDDYQKSLDDEYIVYSKSIIFQNENSVKNDLKNYKNTLENDAVDKEQQFKDASNLLEKLYYNGK